MKNFANSGHFQKVIIYLTRMLKSGISYIVPNKEENLEDYVCVHIKILLILESRTLSQLEGVFSNYHHGLLLFWLAEGGGGERWT